MADEIEKMDLRSMDVVIDKIEQLKALFPEVVTEREVDFEKLKLALGEAVETGRERYGLNWAGKSDCFKIIQQPSVGTLKPVRGESVNFDETENLFIEGDNLEVLKLLQKSYYGKIKMIYIDPPYNTGGDFIYPDDYSENLETYLQYTGQVDAEGKKFSTNTEESGRFHTKWINMMYPRLYLARNLLRDDGVIFISIDDTEADNLKKILDEIFGAENCLASIIWQHSIQPKGYLGKFSVHHNIIYCYSKSMNFELNALERTEEHNKNYSNPDNDPKGPWRSGDVRNALYRPNLIFDIETPSGKIISPPNNGWRWSKETMKKKIETGEIIFNEDETKIIRKIYLANVEGRAPETIWFGKEVGTTRDASSEIKSLFGGLSLFDTAKPIRLIQKMLNLSNEASSDDIILDFFAGSSSTAHAVINQNLEDQGHRKYICVQLPERCDEKTEAYKAGFKTISDVGKERIRKVIQKVSAEISEKIAFDETSLDLGFKVFKLDKSNFKIWQAEDVKDPEKLQRQLELHVDHIAPGSSQEDILYELLLKSGFELTTKIEKIELAGKTVFSIAEGMLLICLEEELTKELIRAMADMEPSRVICLDKGFKNNDQLKTNAVQIMKTKGVEDFLTV